MNIADVNRFTQEEFVQKLGSLFEGPPWIVEEGWHKRPFANRAELHKALCEVMYASSEEQKIALIRAHPDLVGRAALEGTLSRESTGEQASAGLNRLSLEEVSTFNQLNNQYREKFEFPFVICARENKKASILAGFDTRISHTRPQEIEIALGEVAKICAFRLADLMPEE